MRDLDFNELQFVSGANRSPAPPSSGCGCSPCPPAARTTKIKNNNGWGNGPDVPAGYVGAPGKSGTNNSPNAGSKLYNAGR